MGRELRKLMMTEGKEKNKSNGIGVINSRKQHNTQKTLCSYDPYKFPCS